MRSRTRRVQALALLVAVVAGGVFTGASTLIEGSAAPPHHATVQHARRVDALHAFGQPS